MRTPHDTSADPAIRFPPRRPERESCETAAQESSGQNVNDPAVDEWEVPWAESRPRDPYVGPDGRVWFVGQRTSYAAVLDPETGDFKQCDLDDAGPHNLIVDTDG